MNERGHSVLIGAFVLGAALVAVAAALFFGGAGIGSPREKVIMAFDGSVKGLTVGAPVALRGVQIGQVTDIRAVLDLEHADISMVVEAELDESVIRRRGGDPQARRELVDKGLRAQLHMQSVLTGMLYIQLDFHPGTEAVFADLDERLPQIPTIPTELEQLRQTLQSVDYAAMAAAVQEIAEGIRTFVQNDDMRALPQELRVALSSLEAAAARIDHSLERLQPGLDGTLLAVGEAAEGVSAALPRLNTRLDDTLLRLDAVLAATEDTVQGLGDQLGAGSPTLQQLNSTLLEVSRASRALQGLLRLLDEQPDALLRGRHREEPQ